MAVEEFMDWRRNISHFLGSLKLSIDRPPRSKGPDSGEDRERFMQTMMMIEEARIRFGTYTRFQRETTYSEYTELRNELVNFVNEFFNSKRVYPKAYDRLFIMRPLYAPDNTPPTPFVKQFLDAREDKIVIGEALVKFLHYIENTDVDFPQSQIDMLLINETQDTVNLADLGGIVPKQQVSPVQFDIVNGRIVLARTEPRILEADRANICAALDYIRTSGDLLINNLENSNCDRRLLDNVRELQVQLIDNGNVIKIGLMNIGCGMMSSQFQSELPDAIVAMLNSFNGSISLYVSQFPEWAQFTQKAAAAELTQTDILEIDLASAALVKALSDNESFADPEVPKTIAFIRKFLAAPGASSKRAAFAVFRTIENLLSIIMRYSMDFFRKTAEKTIEAGSTTTSKVIAGLLGVALMSATGIGSAAMHAGAPWVKQAAEIVEKHIERMAE